MSLESDDEGALFLGRFDRSADFRQGHRRVTFQPTERAEESVGGADDFEITQITPFTFIEETVGRIFVDVNVTATTFPANGIGKRAHRFERN